MMDFFLSSPDIDIIKLLYGLSNGQANKEIGDECYRLLAGLAAQQLAGRVWGCQMDVGDEAAR